MASTYTSNTGIEKITSGEQAGTWGTTTNTNFDIIDDALNGVVTLTISGNTTLTSNDGTLSDGHHKVLLLGGTPSGAFNLTIDPNDQQKWYFISNATGQTATIKQGGGSGTTLALANGTAAIVYADGSGSNANVAKIDPVIPDASVTSAKLASNAVTTVKITDANVTADKLASNAVTTVKITDSNVTTAKIADDAITTAKIADDAITSATIANDAVALSTQTTGNYVATITAGTGISGSSSSEGGTPTIALATAGAGAATYGSTDDGTKIDTITLDAYGRVTNVATGPTMDNFVLEDGDGTEVTITNDKEVKFVEGGGVDINWTDTSTGSDGDPYDLTFTINTGVTAGDGLTGGGTLSSTRTLAVGAGTGISVSSDAVALSTAGVGAGTYGSTADGTKIDQITVDAYGRITNVTTGSTGTVSTVGSVGKVLQVLQDTATSQTTISTSSRTSFGLSQAITTAGSSNKVLVQANISVDFTAYQTSGDNEQLRASLVSFYLFRGGSEIATVGTVGQIIHASNAIRVMCPILYLDSPGSAASHTYEIKAQTNQTTVARVNISTVGQSDSGSFLIVQEISS